MSSPVLPVAQGDSLCPAASSGIANTEIVRITAAALNALLEKPYDKAATSLCGKWVQIEGEESLPQAYAVLLFAAQIVCLQEQAKLAQQEAIAKAMQSYCERVLPAKPITMTIRCSFRGQPNGVYEGSVNHDLQPEGYGVRTYEWSQTMQKYEGKWFNGKYHGEGTLTLFPMLREGKTSMLKATWEHGEVQGTTGRMVIEKNDGTEIVFLGSFVRSSEKGFLVDGDDCTMIIRKPFETSTIWKGQFSRAVRNGRLSVEKQVYQPLTSHWMTTLSYSGIWENGNQIVQDSGGWQINKGQKQSLPAFDHRPLRDKMTAMTANFKSLLG